MEFNNRVENDSAYDALLNASKFNRRWTPLHILDVHVRQRRSTGGKIVSKTELAGLRFVDQRVHLLELPAAALLPVSADASQELDKSPLVG